MTYVPERKLQCDIQTIDVVVEGLNKGDVLSVNPRPFGQFKLLLRSLRTSESGFSLKFGSIYLHLCGINGVLSGLQSSVEDDQPYNTSGGGDSSDYPMKALYPKRALPIAAL